MRGREGLKAKLLQHELGVDSCGVGGVRAVDERLLVEEGFDEVDSAVPARARCIFSLKNSRLPIKERSASRSFRSSAAIVCRRMKYLCVGKLPGDFVSVDRRGERGAAAGNAVLPEPHALIELRETIAERRGLYDRELALRQELMLK